MPTGNLDVESVAEWSGDETGVAEEGYCGLEKNETEEAV
jgi:hypothetical protein